MQLYSLGTGAGSPSAARNVSATLLYLQQERGGVWLFDCDEASQHSDVARAVFAAPSGKNLYHPSARRSSVWPAGHD